MLRALSEYQVYGIKTIIPFFKRILLHPKFNKGDYNTHFIAELEKKEEKIQQDEQVIALIAAGVKSYKESRAAFTGSRRKVKSNWKIQGRMNSISNRM